MENSLKEKISSDLKSALKEKNARKTSVLRMLLSDLKNLEIESRKPAADADVMKILSGSAKRHQDSIEQFKTGGRADLVAQEEEELAIIKNYLPEQLSDSEVAKLVDEAIAETGAATAADFGKAMKAVMLKLAGRANGQTVSQMLKAKLARQNL